MWTKDLKTFLVDVTKAFKSFYLRNAANAAFLFELFVSFLQEKLGHGQSLETYISCNSQKREEIKLSFFFLKL